MNHKKIALVSIVLLVLSISVAQVAADQTNSPPYALGWTSNYSVPTWTGGSSDHSESVNWNTGYIRLFSYSSSNWYGQIETHALGYISTVPVYATSSGVVQILGKLTLNGAGLLYAISPGPAGAGSALDLRLSYQVYDDSTGQCITNTIFWQYSDRISSIGSFFNFWIPNARSYTWNNDRDISGNFMAISGHYYDVRVCLEIATMGYSGIGVGQGTVDFSSYKGNNYYAFLQYVSLVGPVGPPPPSGGGCPFLSVYDGSQYAVQGLLDIHTGYNGSDLTVSHVLATTPQAVDGRYLLRLTEHWSTKSHIDQVKLYATLSNGRTVPLRLVSAIHSQLDNVLPQLLHDDNRDAVILGAKWNNGTSQSIDLQFLALPSFMHAVSFTFVIDGYNPIPTV